jgi:isoamylase
MRDKPRPSRCHPVRRHGRGGAAHQAVFELPVRPLGLADVSWHGCKLNEPRWTDPETRTLAMTLGEFDGAQDIHVMLNMDSRGFDFEVPKLNDREWFKAVDTAAASPDDIPDAGSEPTLPRNVCAVAGRSIVVLVSR